MPDVSITVNGEPYKVDSSKMLIEELIANGISVPHFCYHEALGIDGNCRMCMVEIEGQKRPQIACNTPITDGMQISTQSDSIMQVKRSILELELINHPVDCPICDQAGECSLQEYYMEVGLHESRIDVDHKVKKRKHVDLGSNVVLDQERCVLCARCTRFTANITQTHDLVIADRGNHACVTTFDGPLEAKGYAMNVVDLCPVGALTSKDFRFAQRVWFLKSDASICHGCAKGCNIYIDSNKPKYEASKIYRFRPRKNEAVNGHFICDAGRLSYKELNENRLVNAFVSGEDTDLAQALLQTAERIQQRHTNTLILLSPSLNLEEMMALKAFGEYHNIPVYGHEPSSIDPEFEDDMLKNRDRASNRYGLKLLQIDEDCDAFEQALSHATLVLNFNNLEGFTKSDEKWIHFSTHRHSCDALQIPIYAYSEKCGTVINADGFMQHYRSTMPRNHDAFEISKALDLLSRKHFVVPLMAELVSRYLPQVPILEWESVVTDGQTVKVSDA